MKKLALFSVLTLSVALFGCDKETKITDGQLPNELLPYVQPFLGDYHGQIERQSAALSMKLDGNRLVLTSANDLIAPACETKIGNLVAVYTEKKDGTVHVTRAVFAFDPNLCANEVAGRNLELNFTSESPITFDIDYLDHYEERQRCDDVGGSPAPPYTGPIVACHMESVPFYNEGRFQKN